MERSFETWAAFNLLILGLLALDIGLFNRRAHVIRLKEALLWSLFWIALGVAFGGYVWLHEGRTAGILYLTGYVVEKSLSVDNLFVFLVIFQSLRIDRKYQHRLLFWGILGAIVLRGLMIAAGTALLVRFHWLIYVFGVFLIYTGVKLLLGGGESADPRNGRLFKLLERVMPLSEKEHAGRFFVVENGRKKASIALLALVLVEFSDVLFALDSVPAVFGVTRDPYIVYTSNIFAILGLRALFFVLQDFMDRFHLLKYGLSAVLVLVGVKMCFEEFVHVPPALGLAVVGVLLGIPVIMSFVFPSARNNGLSSEKIAEPEIETRAES